MDLLYIRIPGVAVDFAQTVKYPNLVRKPYECADLHGLFMRCPWRNSGLSAPREKASEPYETAVLCGWFIMRYTADGQLTQQHGFVSAPANKRENGTNPVFVRIIDTVHRG